MNILTYIILIYPKLCYKALNCLGLSWSAFNVFEDIDCHYCSWHILGYPHFFINVKTSQKVSQNDPNSGIPFFCGGGWIGILVTQYNKEIPRKRGFLLPLAILQLFSVGIMGKCPRLEKKWTFLGYWIDFFDLFYDSLAAMAYLTYGYPYLCNSIWVLISNPQLRQTI